GGEGGRGGGGGGGQGGGGGGLGGRGRLAARQGQEREPQGRSLAAPAHEPVRRGRRGRGADRPQGRDGHQSRGARRQRALTPPVHGRARAVPQADGGRRGARARAS